MTPAPIAPDEPGRLLALRRYGIVDTPPEQEWDDLAALAAQICGTPIALISLVDADRQWFKSKVGLNLAETPRAISFCGHAVLQTEGLFVVPDTTEDERFVNNPLVTGDLQIRFYAGAPLMTPDHHVLGALCVMDRVPRTLTEEQREALAMLSRQVMTQLELRRDITKDREIRDQLVWKTAFFEAQVNSALDAILVADQDGLKVVQNQRMIDLWSLPREIAAEREDQRRHEWMALQVKDPREFSAKVGQLLNYPDAISRDQLELLDGRIFDRYSAPVRAAEGKYYGRIWTYRDITEQKRVEADREASEARHRALFECAPDGMAISDAGCFYLNANRSLCQMLGYRREELIGIHSSHLVVEAESGLVGPATQALQAGAELRREWLFRRKDGSVFPAEVLATTLPDGNLLSMIRDVTERKRSLQTIAEQAALLDKARDAVLVRALHGGFTFWNQGAERLFGWTAAEVLADPQIGDQLYPDLAQKQKIIGTVLAEGEWQGEVTHFTKDGLELAIESRWTLIRDTAGAAKSMLVINSDITERKKLEARFLRAQRMESIGTLAGGVAHDLNNILSPILMSIEVLKMGAIDPCSRKILDTIELSAQRGADIVRQVLSFARGVKSALVKVEPRAVLRDLESLIKETFPKDLRLRFGSGKECWPILGDPTQLHQILLNLTVNARDAMPHGGSLFVTAENQILDEQYAAMNLDAKPGRYVCLSVSDTGTGIPAEIVDKIFDPFFTTKDINKGTGLGLSTVMGIVKSHAGVINVFSEPGKGTTFRVYLPAFAEGDEAARIRDEAEQQPRGRGETILVVDDEAAILNITAQTLQAFGYRVLTAPDGAQAVAIYAMEQAQIAVVLTDMMMPVMDGRATIRALERINPAVKIIAASGLNANGTIPSQESGRRFLAKPYTAGMLLTTIASLLESNSG